MTSELTDVHDAVEQMAAKLEQAGFGAGDIVDALIIRGINAGIRLTDREHMATFLDKMAVQVRSGATLSATKH